MRGKKVKNIRKYLLNDIENAMIQIRNHCGSRTETMSETSFYRTAKKLYKMGKLILTNKKGNK